MPEQLTENDFRSRGPVLQRRDNESQATMRVSFVGVVRSDRVLTGCSVAICVLRAIPVPVYSDAVADELVHRRVGRRR